MELKYKITENNTEELQQLLNEAAEIMKRLQELTKQIGEFKIKIEVESEVV